MAGIFDQLTATHRDQKNADGVTVSDTQGDEIQQESTVVENHHAGDSANHYTLKQIKEVSQQLLKYGLLESATKSSLYRAAVTHQAKLNEILEPLDLAIKIDDIRGLAFVVVANSDTGEEDGEQWSHPLVRRQRLNLEQSLLVAILRQHFVNHELEAGVGDNTAVIHLDELLPEINAYLGELGSETLEDKRLRNLLEQLKAYGVVTDVNEYEQLTIRPLIAHVANPENLKNLLVSIKNKTNDARKERDS